jgi:hypothetical protein
MATAFGLQSFKHLAIGTFLSLIFAAVCVGAFSPSSLPYCQWNKNVQRAGKRQSSLHTLVCAGTDKKDIPEESENRNEKVLPAPVDRLLGSRRLAAARNVRTTTFQQIDTIFFPAC